MLLERKGEDVRNWIDCIFIAMLCDGGGKGQVYQYPLVPWGHTPYLSSKPCTMQKSTIYGSKFSVTRTNQTLLIEGLARSAGSHDFLWGHQEALWTEAWLSNDRQVAWITVLMCLLFMQLENLLPSIFKPTSFLILLIRRIILVLGYTTKTDHWMSLVEQVTKLPID